MQYLAVVPTIVGCVPDEHTLIRLVVVYNVFVQFMYLSVNTYLIAVGVLIMAIGIYWIRKINSMAEDDDTYSSFDELLASTTKEILV